jgi:hypothetical protein
MPVIRSVIIGRRDRFGVISDKYNGLSYLLSIFLSPPDEVIREIPERPSLVRYSLSEL